MTTPRDVESYPDWFMALANEVEGGVNRKVLQLPSAHMVDRYRRNLYGFRNAMRRAGMLPMYPRFQTIRLAISGSDLIIMTAEEYLPNPEKK
jgi:hypothetical protein